MKRVAVIFGGKTVEHEVSIITGMQIIENIDKNKYEIIPIYIDKDGRWLTGPELMNFKNFKEDNFKDLKEIIVSPNHENNKIYIKPEDVGVFKKKVIGEIDIAFPAIHGMNGEDGTLQGVFELMNIPYVGGGVSASSVGMDKILMKDVYKANGLPLVDYFWFYRSKWKEDKDKIIDDIEKNISYPLFVKPSNLGSSIGISKAKNKEELINSIEIAINYDRKILIEKAVENGREINCAVMGYEENLITSMCEEPLGWEEILTFEDKYVKSNMKSGKDSGERTIIPAKIEENIKEKIESLAKLAFKAIDSRGVSRIDFLLDEKENIYINEINTIPGSLAFYLWEDQGYPFIKLIDELINIALRAHKEKQENLYLYEVNLLNKIEYGSKISKV